MSKAVCVQEAVMLAMIGACAVAGMAAGGFLAEVPQGWPTASQQLGPVRMSHMQQQKKCLAGLGGSVVC